MTRDSGFILRPATATDVRQLLGQQAPVSLKAWTCERSGKLAGIGGIALYKDKPTVFLEISDDCGMSKRQIWEAIKQGFALVTRSHGPLLAIRNCDKPNSRALLERCGFRYYATDKENQEVYVR
jgi:hypothetical protein